MEEQKNAKKYEDLNCYERAMANASLEQRMEAMAKDLQQIALALKTSVHVCATFHDWDDNQHTSCNVFLIKDDKTVKRDDDGVGFCFGIIEEANKKEDPTD